jgi:hypothetical protein
MASAVQSALETSREPQRRNLVRRRICVILSVRRVPRVSRRPPLIGRTLWGQRLILKRASTSRPSGQWNDDDFDVLAVGAVVGRIMRANAAPVGMPWMWTLAFRAPRRPNADARPCCDARGRDGGVREELAARMKESPRCPGQFVLLPKGLVMDRRNRATLLARPADAGRAGLPSGRVISP